MGGRGGNSGMGKPIVYTTYGNMAESKKGLGLGNGGATDKWLGGLSKEEADSVRKYTTSAGSKLNRSIRHDVPLTKSQQSIDDGLQSAISKYKLDKPTTFTRWGGPSLLGGADTVEAINSKIGQVVHDKSYTSASATSSSYSGKIAFHINTPAGKGIGAYVQPISAHKSENEFLFNRGSAFRIAGAYTGNGGQVHCNLEYIGRS